MAEKETLICQIENTMIEANIHGPSGLVGNARTIKPTTVISGVGRGDTYSKKVQLSNPMHGVVIAYKAITDASPTSLIDRLRYSAAERPNFQMFSFVYKVWIPGIPGSTYNLFECEDWNDKDAFEAYAAQSPWVPIDISAGMNVQGAIPPATSVKVRFGSTATLTDPKIVEIGENIPKLIVPAMQKSPPGEAFKLGAPTGFGGAVSGELAAKAEGVTEPAPNDPNVRADDMSPIKGIGTYGSNSERKANIITLVRIMEEQGVTNRFTKIAMLAVAAKESGLIPKSEGGWGGASVSRAREIFGARVKEFTDKELKDPLNSKKGEGTGIMHDDKKMFNAVYGTKWYGSHLPKSPRGWAKHDDPNDGYNYRGRGFNQITFKASYEKYGNLVNIDFVGSPDLLNDPQSAGIAALTFWLRGLKSKYPDVNVFTSQEEANIAVAQSNCGWGRDCTRGINHTNKRSHYFK